MENRSRVGGNGPGPRGSSPLKLSRRRGAGKESPFLYLLSLGSFRGLRSRNPDPVAGFLARVPHEEAKVTTIESILTRDVVTLDPGMTLKEAAERLTVEGLSGAPVVSGTRLVGVVSLSDLVAFQASNPGVPFSREDPAEGGEGGGAERWEEDPADSPAGYFVDFWSESKGDVAERFAHPGGPEWDLLSEHTVAEIMTRRVVALPLEASVREVAQLMIQKGIHRVLILQDAELAGIVTPTDVVRAVAEGRLS